ncbi:MAG: DNA repair protein RecN [Gammaproteobacteria bacterium]|uniref:DNA repair protein RecN n=1 Tax=Hydrogenophaga sp. TaxID=1904254 RepID=UPI0008B35B33|nr:DNA repair protein RecN [Hydrogenophaga sp.]MBU4181628.1 DNA repair protein RecN [Gammaproteobacteria bacterium]OGB35985.1 MAG: DNA repair protein RecN [Burkholderiales bacterium RIFCSPLOWO2_02_FULL_66_35]MBU4279439.1 DNA repair protein RecN [Gammaproteobacteria bacterium]MBU4326022.1 DNA repair protein RecN [Gammaproteobacteria bacterium]MCG2656775.1 DNA repair protein RecN [Hydrogenophaga sp.]
MSLRRIVLRDFVIVQSLDLELNPGFCVLTGETGAGKSILIDALQLALGARADSGVVREGASRCEIAAEFDLPPHLAPWLDEQGFTREDSLLVRRTVDTDGRSRAWINGSAATMAQLKALANDLVDIHGQHAWQSLTRSDAVRALLDGYAGIDTTAATQAWTQWRLRRKALETATERQSTLQQESERLAWQIAELDKLQPAVGEWEELNSQHSRLANAQALLDAANAATLALEEDESSAAALIHRALSALQAQAGIEPQFSAPVEALEAALAQVQDTVHSLHQYSRRTDLDPASLAVLDERLGLWMSLARRYRRPPEELAALHAQWKSDLAGVDQALDLAALNAAERGAWQAFAAELQTLSKRRQQAAPKLSKAVTETMQTLGLQGGRFEVALQKLDEPQAHGWEQVEFLVAGHAGVSPRPVGKVASGGELSRIALAISVVTSQLGQAPTLIFDEVDSGIGGAVAHTVGQLLRQLGHDRQVLAVTHLPQVAACADHHLLVSKQLQGQQTLSTVAPITRDHRVVELARMLGGSERSEVSLAHARELLTP